MPYTHVIDRPQTLKLKDVSTEAPKGISKSEAAEKVGVLANEMEELFDLMFFSGQHSLLIVLQGMDTSGKDGTIRHVLSYSHAQSCKVSPFKVPTPIELSHDFLWRVHQQTPGKGEVAIFNRSHYEDVLVVRVHSIVPESTWKERYEHINRFENLLAASNTVVLKFFLHISKDEQERRLLDREMEVEKAWKLSIGDWTERKHWDSYQAAYEDAIGKCASPHAPWHVVPADKKWFRNLAVTEAIVASLRPLKQDWIRNLEAIGAKAKAELEAYRKTL